MGVVRTLLWWAVGLAAVHVALTGPWAADAGRWVRAQTFVSATPIATPVGR